MLFAAGMPFITKKREHYAVPGTDVIRMMRETKVFAAVTAPCTLQKEIAETAGFNVAAKLIPGQTVEIIRDHQAQWYFVREIITGNSGWLQRDDISIPPDTPARQDTMNPAELEAYANAMGYASKTAYLAVVDIDRQKVYVYKGSKYKWRLSRAMPCSTGKNESPTVTGQFELEDRGLWFYSERLGSGGKYWVRFDGPYLFHSLPMSRDGAVLDETLGERNSNGCVRLSVADAEWLYDTAPDGSCVIII
jgi:lipoprotein-anchoring transpeptidase ErfK/SrfK